MALIRNEIYDDNGLLEVQYIVVDDIKTEDLIKQKEQELLEVFKEIQRLKDEQGTI